ncbi:MAG TPA: ACT domain-containing protein, partial [Symbiobacteriaceae bacterium]|nr:ACT domain-containing protein [Symbiobacteriaceae bacterium]
MNRLGGIRLILRLEIQNTGAIFSYLATAIGAAGGDILAVDLIQSRKEVVVRDVTIGVEHREHGNRVVQAVAALPGVKVVNV